ncbi:hypothetical protein DY000_02006027 [Brassica cretica]|uniref:Uncharacterized protein n=1 Tax=Brassica cretica TaxID=69181 RepID=A0ABQ7CK38_BRACR|nr:hypothetical protein DY000_02006027 [Brassica cretica]
MTCLFRASDLYFSIACTPFLKRLCSESATKGVLGARVSGSAIVGAFTERITGSPFWFAGICWVPGEAEAEASSGGANGVDGSAGCLLARSTCDEGDWADNDSEEPVATGETVFIRSRYEDRLFLTCDGDVVSFAIPIAARNGVINGSLFNPIDSCVFKAIFRSQRRCEIRYKYM